LSQCHIKRINRNQNKLIISCSPFGGGKALANFLKKASLFGDTLFMAIICKIWSHKTDCPNSDDEYCLWRVSGRWRLNVRRLCIEFGRETWYRYYSIYMR
jgi:hypothetical protein